MTKHLPSTRSIIGTRMHCSELTYPLSTIVSPRVLDQLTRFYMTITPLFGYTIPDDRMVLIGQDQRVGRPRPGSTRLQDYKPLINDNSILFDGSEIVSSLPILSAYFKYMTCELGWVGLDLCSGQNASDIGQTTGGAASLFNNILGPDIFRIDALVRWVMAKVDLLGLEYTFDATQNTIADALESGVWLAEKCAATGLYDRMAHGIEATAPFTPDDFARLQAGEFYPRGDVRQLPPPAMPPVASLSPAQVVTESPVPPAQPAPEPVPRGALVGEVLFCNSMADFGKHTESMTRGAFEEQLMVPSLEPSIVNFESFRKIRIPRIRFVYVVNKQIIYCHLYPIHYVCQVVRRNIRPSEIANRLGGLAAAMGVRWSNSYFEMGTIGGVTSALVSKELLLAWVRKSTMMDPDVAETLLDLAARMEDLEIPVKQGGQLELIFSGPHCHAYQVFDVASCGCREETIVDDCVDHEAELRAIQEAEGRVEVPARGKGLGCPQCQSSDTSLVDGLRMCGVCGARFGEPVDLMPSMDDYIRHARGMFLVEIDRAKGCLDRAAEKAVGDLKSCMEQILNGLHKTLDPDDYARNHPEEAEVE